MMMLPLLLLLLLLLVVVVVADVLIREELEFQLLASVSEIRCAHSMQESLRPSWSFAPVCLLS
jgi:hypothetical protein